MSEFNINDFLKQVEFEVEVLELKKPMTGLVPEKVKLSKGKRTCLGCENRFVPIDKHNKMCKACRFENGLDD